MLLYTDGVTDASVNGCVLDLEGLHRIVFEAGDCSAAELVAHVCGQLNSDPDALPRDDIAVLAVSFDGVGAPCNTRSWRTK